MTPVLILTGAISIYHPGDGHNAGELACGGKFTWQQEHIAIRQWRRVGCGAKARVCVYDRGTTRGKRMRRSSRFQRCDEQPLLLAGKKPRRRNCQARQRVGVHDPTRGRRGNGFPVGTQQGALSPVSRCIWTEVRDSGPWGAKHPDGRWEVQIKLKPGWHRRAVVDLSWALWKALGSPPFLSRVKIEVYR